MFFYDDRKSSKPRPDDALFEAEFEMSESFSAFLSNIKAYEGEEVVKPLGDIYAKHSFSFDEFWQGNDCPVLAIGKDVAGHVEDGESCSRAYTELKSLVRDLHGLTTDAQSAVSAVNEMLSKRAKNHR